MWTHWSGVEPGATSRIEIFERGEAKRYRGLGFDATMSAKTLAVIRMDGPEDRAAEELGNPAWQDIESAIRRLNGDTCSLLILGIGDPVPHMGIGGGEDGKYIVYVT